MSVHALFKHRFPDGFAFYTKDLSQVDCLIVKNTGASTDHMNTTVLSGVALPDPLNPVLFYSYINNPDI